MQQMGGRAKRDSAEDEDASGRARDGRVGPAVVSWTPADCGAHHRPDLQREGEKE